MLRMAYFFTSHAALQPVQQLLAAHGYTMAALAQLLQPPSSDGSADSTPLQQLQENCPQLAVLPDYEAAVAAAQQYSQHGSSSSKTSAELHALQQQLLPQMPLQAVALLLQALAAAQQQMQLVAAADAAGGSSTG
jgi:hypothetical protein